MPIGWMIRELFLQVMKNFVQYPHSSKENECLFIYDNHESHLDPQVISNTKENDVIIVTIQPHCSSKLQPLSVELYKSLKTSSTAIYNIPGIFRDAFIQSMTPANITGTFPLNRNIFTVVAVPTSTSTMTNASISATAFDY